MMALIAGFFLSISCMARPSSKPGRIQPTYSISPPKISFVSSWQRRLAATAMIAFGCMWSTCLPVRKLWSGVSIDEGRGLRLKVVWA